MAASVARVPSRPTAQESLAAKVLKVAGRAKRIRGGVRSGPKPDVDEPQRPKPGVASVATLLQIVVSAQWAEEAQAAMGDGRADRRMKLSAVYRSLFHGSKTRGGFYPPRDAGRPSLMRTCPECGLDCPPTNTEPVGGPGRAGKLCVDCRENYNAPEHYERKPAAYADGGAWQVKRIEGKGEIVGTGEAAKLALEAAAASGREVARRMSAEPRDRRDSRSDKPVPVVGVAILDVLRLYQVPLQESPLEPEDDAALRKEIRRFNKGQWRPDPGP